MCSMQLHIRYLRSLEDSERVRVACITYLQNWLPFFYPNRPDLVKEAEEMAVSLGGALDPPAFLEVLVICGALRRTTGKASESLNGALQVVDNAELGQAAFPAAGQRSKKEFVTMHAMLRKILTTNSVSRRFYYAAREAYHTRRVSRGAGRYFLNSDQFKIALRAHGKMTTPMNLRTIDGLTITMRQNYGDAMTIAEIFLDDCYVRDLPRPHNFPVVIDLGGFIGDFSLYAVKRLNARRVIVCEPYRAIGSCC